MRETIYLIQIVISIFLIVLITIQVKGGGLGRGIMASNSFSRRGFEKLVFKSTFVLCAAFLLISTATLVL